MSASGGPPAEIVGSLRHFPFVVNTRPLVQGTLGGLTIVSLILAWAWLTGRLRNVDGTYAGVVLGSVAASSVFVIGRMWRQARKAASSLGYFEMDDEGVRWHRGDSSLGFDISWKDVERATIDAQNFTVLLSRRTDTPILLGALSNHGVPSDFVVPARFNELAELVRSKTSTALHGGAKDIGAARRTVLLGLLSCIVAAALYVANLGISSLLGWHRLLVHMPIAVGVFGLITWVAGLRIRFGKGPMVSPLYSPSYRATVIRFLVVASIANFALVGLLNTVAR